MKALRAINVSKKTDIASHVRVATSILERAVGLLGTSTLPPGEGLWISPCKSIHTFFMRYPIDVLFLDEKGTVIAQETLRPWRISRWQLKARGVLEVNAGAAQNSQTVLGDRIELKDEV